MVRVKVCGMSDPSLISQIEPDFIGIIVGTPDSKRNVSLDYAEELLKNVNERTKKVLVTRNCDLQFLEMIDGLNPDYIQIHSVLDQDIISKLRSNLSSGIIALIGKENVHQVHGISDVSDYVIIDSGTAGKYGGMGIENNWELVSELRKFIPYGKMIASGGINPRNMERVYEKTRADVLDASSGLEINGKKDLKLILEFINKGRLLE